MGRRKWKYTALPVFLSFRRGERIPGSGDLLQQRADVLE